MCNCNAWSMVLVRLSDRPKYGHQQDDHVQCKPSQLLISTHRITCKHWSIRQGLLICVQACSMGRAISSKLIFGQSSKSIDDGSLIQAQASTEQAATTDSTWHADTWGLLTCQVPRNDSHDGLVSGLWRNAMAC